MKPVPPVINIDIAVASIDEAITGSNVRAVIERPAFTIGIEEEYLCVDRETRDLIKAPPQKMWDSLREVVGPQVTHEFLRAQIEVGTKVCTSVAEAREDLATMRRDLSSVVGEYGGAIIASSTHPFANWEQQERLRIRRSSVTV